jgi:hypothetical protein
MGDGFHGAEPGGGHEDGQLARLCESIMPFPKMRKFADSKTIQGRLIRWQASLSKRAQAAGRSLYGGKYPHLCAFMREIMSVWPDAKIIHASRPLEQSIASLIRREPRRDAAQLKKLQEWLWEEKQKFLAEVPHYTVDYSEMCENSQSEVEKLSEFLRVPCTENAVNFVDKKRRNCY